jgi:hypothetical protein
MNRLRYLWSDRRYLVSRRREALVRWVAWHLPRELVKWCYYRVGAHATTGKYGNTNVSELGMMDAIKRWDEPHVPK